MTFYFLRQHFQWYLLFLYAQKNPRKKEVFLNRSSLKIQSFMNCQRPYSNFYVCTQFNVQNIAIYTLMCEALSIV